jgi:hypothetical protein
MSDFNPFLLEQPATSPEASAEAAKVAQIASATNVPREVVAAAIAFEKAWTDRGLPASDEAMGARTALGQSALALSFGFGVSAKTLAEYVIACVEETKALNTRYGLTVPIPPPTPTAAPAIATSSPTTPSSGSSAPEEEEDDEDDEGEDVEVDDDRPDE